MHGQSAQDEANFASWPCNSIDKVIMQFGDLASGLGKVVKWM